jgi:hypothetical protein
MGVSLGHVATLSFVVFIDRFLRQRGERLVVIVTGVGRQCKLYYENADQLMPMLHQAKSHTNVTDQ